MSAHLLGSTQSPPSIPSLLVSLSPNLADRLIRSGSQGYGFPTSEATAIESTVTFKPSMLLDVEAGRPCELEVIIGALLDRARARGVATPRLDLVYASLKIHQDAAVSKYAESETHKQHIADWLKRRPAVAGAGLEGRKAWEKAMKASEKVGLDRVKVEMARGVPKGELEQRIAEMRWLTSLLLPLFAFPPFPCLIQSLFSSLLQSLGLLSHRKRLTRAIRRSRSLLGSTESRGARWSANEHVEYRASNLEGVTTV